MIADFQYALMAGRAGKGVRNHYLNWRERVEECAWADPYGLHQEKSSVTY